MSTSTQPNPQAPSVTAPSSPVPVPTALTTVSADPPSAASAGIVPTRISARRLQAIQPFQVMEIVKQAAARIADGHPVIQLSIGEPDFTAPAPVVERLAREVRGGRTGYTEALGILPLREAIAGHYASRYGVPVDPARIMVTAGASAALTLICLALIDPGDEVLMTDPSYPCNRHFVAAADGVPVTIPVGPGSRFQMTEAALISHWGPRVRGTLLASPANPTGTSIPFEELARIVAAARERHGFAIVDEIYLDLYYGLDGTPGSDAGSRARTAVELGEDVIVTNSFSKYFNMTGWRLGWMVLPPALVPELEKLAQNLFICPSTLAQQAALACFEPGTIAIYDERKAAFKARRDYLVPALEKAGLAVPAMPDGAFYVYADCSAWGMDSATYARRLLEEADVSLVPGTDFGQADPDRYLRISYATAMDDLVEAVARIARFNATLDPG